MYLQVEGTELINFDKCWELSRHLVEFQKYQSGVCDLQSDGNIQVSQLLETQISQSRLFRISRLNFNSLIWSTANLNLFKNI